MQRDAIARETVNSARLAACSRACASLRASLTPLHAKAGASKETLAGKNVALRVLRSKDVDLGKSIMGVRGEFG